jgi:hypothetical protein
MRKSGGFHVSEAPARGGRTEAPPAVPSRAGEGSGISRARAPAPRARAHAGTCDFPFTAAAYVAAHVVATARLAA